jgi:hypothetical protein
MIIIDIDNIRVKNFKFIIVYSRNGKVKINKSKKKIFDLIILI